MGGGTATRVALDKAQMELANTFAKDDRYSCLRPYGAILVTDGQSNVCNNPPEDLEWSGTGDPPVTTLPCATTATTSYRLFPAGNAEDIWNLALTKPCADKPGRLDQTGAPDPINPRTWVIGFGQDVGKCELNWTAFMGRTDANDANPKSENKAAGYLWKTDPNLCKIYDAGTDTCTSAVPFTDNFVAGNDYAFFASNSGAVVDAIQQIVNATAKGDYTTSQGVSGGSAGGAGNIMLIPSADFPAWQGHLYKLDLNLPRYPTPRDPIDYYKETDGYRKDAATTLATMSSDKRQIWTWDPRTGHNFELVPVTKAKLDDGTLAAIETAMSGTSTINAAILDFIRGNNGTGYGSLGAGPGAARPARLGPMINSTPAIVGMPAQYKQSNGLGGGVDHKTFEGEYGGADVTKQRRPLIWVGADDGMLHAFDFADMSEVLAILPPNLIALQSQLYSEYQTYVSTAGLKGSITGQKKSPLYADHSFGVANSLRFGDVIIGTEYRTVGFLTEGPGGNLIAALDITHPYPGVECTTPPCAPGSGCSSPPCAGHDPNWGGFPTGTQGIPFQVLWSKTSGSGTDQLPGLTTTWAVPAMGPYSTSNWTSIFGGGEDAASTFAAQQKEPVFMLDPGSGNKVGSLGTYSKLFDPDSVATPFVGNKMFADAVLFQASASGFFSDNIVDVGIQADLNGRIWAIKSSDVTTTSLLIDATGIAGQSQPIYYPPSASGFEPGSGGVGWTGCNVYAFASGTFYENSSAVTGLTVGTAPNFVPSLYVAADLKKNTQSMKKIPDANVLRFPIAGTYTQKDAAGVVTATYTLSTASQVTAAPFLLVEPKGAAPSRAIFVAYDPTQGCNGNTFVITIDFEATSSCTPTNTAFAVYDAGPGAASGIVIAGERIEVVKSGVGRELAGVYEPPDIKAAVGAPANPRPLWWKELK
jgi:hypothetical protein